MNVQGKWTGTIIYGKEYSANQNKELYFDIDILQAKEKITGTAIDTGGFGVSPDSASIIGTIAENKINFIKQYASRHTYNRSGQTIIDKSRPGPEINYTGLYDGNRNTFNGDWKMTVTYKIFWVIPIKLSATGTWNMKIK